MVQFPLSFEFSQDYLTALYDQMLGCLHGTFLHNCDEERVQTPEFFDTSSVWDHMRDVASPTWTNFMYVPRNATLRPLASLAVLELWPYYYESYHRDPCLFGLATQQLVLQTRVSMYQALEKHRDHMLAKLGRLNSPVPALPTAETVETAAGMVGKQLGCGSAGSCLALFLCCLLCSCC